MKKKFKTARIRPTLMQVRELKAEIEVGNLIIAELKASHGIFATKVSNYYGQMLALKVEIGNLHAALIRIDRLPAGIIVEARTIARKAITLYEKANS